MYKFSKVKSIWFLVVWWWVIIYGCTEDSSSQVKQSNELTKNGFIHIPGPNPILMNGEKGSWDDVKIEACDALRDHDTYFLYYHGNRKGWQIGVATSKSPLGPFERYSDKPILPQGPKDSWDEKNVACAMVLKDDDNRYYMFYSGVGNPPKHTGDWDIGFAVADHPLGPWEKYDKNPILKDFGYLGSVVKVDGKYYLYAAHPVSSIVYDYQPFSMAVADSLEGPWEMYPGNPILKQGQPGEWDDGGFSESEFLYQNGIFHTFYGGSRTNPHRMLTRENLGYAYSFNGYDWIKYGLNPVAKLDDSPLVASFAEVHTIMELPFIYIYHTQRYTQPCQINGKERRPQDEDLGVQVLVTQRPFSLNMPLLNMDSLGPAKTVTLDSSPPVNLSYINKLVLTAECEYSKNAKSGIRLHVISSYDGIHYETTDLYTLDNDFTAGRICRKTFILNAPVKFIKVIVENLDKSQSVTNVNVVATLSG